MSDNEKKQEPSFDAAPQRAGAISGSLKAKPANYKRLNPKVKNAIIFGGAGIAALILFAIMSINDNPAKAEKKQDEKSVPMTMTGTTPKAVTEAPDGVPSASGIAFPDASAPAGMPVPSGAASAALASSGVPGIGGRDPLAGAGAGQVPGLSGGYPDRGTPREKSPAEMAAERAANLRAEALQRGADSSLSGQDQSAGGGLSPALQKVADRLTSLGGGAGGVGAGQPAPIQASSDDPNKQVRKEQFLKDAQAAAQISNVLLQPVTKPISQYTINAGWLIPAIMVSGLNSDLPGQLRAQVRENVKDTVTGQYTLIPRGSTLVGTYDSQVSFGQSRVLVVWSRVIFPDGSSLNLQGMPGADEQGFAGLTGDVNNHMWPIIKAAVFMSVISAGAQLSQTPQTTTNGSYGAPSAGSTLAAALGQQLGQAGTQLFSRYLNIQPTITTDPGTRFNILVTKDMVFPQPWAWKETEGQQ
ncbi:TrbI/VirB10 family protein [Paraburkholderia sp. A3RO-2L]|uniref:TrbI/VirB10 family protein n=1 Tax=Paraburkholderia sp. A3RO-2L TaxID=3028376 RepID=UPI003DA8208A